MKNYTINGNEITTRDAGAVINSDAGRLYLFSIKSAAGAAVYCYILPQAVRPFRVYYTGGGIWPRQLRKLYKTPAGAARYIAAVAAAWGGDLKSREYITADEKNEILSLPWWEFDNSDAGII